MRSATLLLPALLLACFTFADDGNGPTSPDTQPVGENFSVTPAPAPFILDKHRTELEQVVYEWPAKDPNLLRVIRLVRNDPISQAPDADRTPQKLAEFLLGDVPKDQLIGQAQVLKDPRFDAKVRYVLKGEGYRRYEMTMLRRVGKDEFIINTFVTVPGNRSEPQIEAIQKLAEDLAMTIRAKGEPSPGPLTFGSAHAAAVKPATKPVAVAPSPATKPAADSSAVAADHPLTLEQARAIKSQDPAAAYAALKAIAAGSSAEAKPAAQDAAALERDPAAAKKIMAAEGKVFTDLSMAQNFQNLGQVDKAKQRYQQIIKEHPNTMCAATARARLEEIDKATAPKP